MLEVEAQQQQRDISPSASTMARHFYSYERYLPPGSPILQPFLKTKYVQHVSKIMDGPRKGPCRHRGIPSATDEDLHGLDRSAGAC